MCEVAVMIDEDSLYNDIREVGNVIRKWTRRETLISSENRGGIVFYERGSFPIGSSNIHSKPDSHDAYVGSFNGIGDLSGVRFNSEHKDPETLKKIIFHELNNHTNEELLKKYKIQNGKTKSLQDM